MFILYYALRAFLFLFSLPPVSWVARLGRLVGHIAYTLDARHRKVTQENLKLIFGKEWDEDKIRATAKENYIRVIEAYFSAISTLQMSSQQLTQHLHVTHLENVRPKDDPSYGKSRVALIGHFGNFELYAKVANFLPDFQFATTYRGFDNKIADRLLSALRGRSKCLFFERRHQGTELKQAMSNGGLLIGFLADQHPGDRGMWLPFMGVECQCSTSAAVFALRYHCPIVPSFCYRVAPGKWEIDFPPEIPTQIDGKPREISEIMTDINAAYEKAIRRDPANWFWVHRRWKSYFRRLEMEKKTSA